MFPLLLILQALVAFSLVVVILMQRSEGGGFGVGGSPTSSTIGHATGGAMPARRWPG